MYLLIILVHTQKILLCQKWNLSPKAGVTKTVAAVYEKISIICIRLYVNLPLKINMFIEYLE
jgi:hypothetical protein